VDTVLKIPLHLLFYIALGTLSYLKLCTNSREEPKKFPRSKKVPEAMLKQAYAFRALGDMNTYRVILKTLESRFPKFKVGSGL